MQKYHILVFFKAHRSRDGRWHDLLGDGALHLPLHVFLRSCHLQLPMGAHGWEKDYESPLINQSRKQRSKFIASGKTKSCKMSRCFLVKASTATWPQAWLELLLYNSGPILCLPGCCSKTITSSWNNFFVQDAPSPIQKGRLENSHDANQ